MNDELRERLVKGRLTENLVAVQKNEKRPLSVRTPVRRGAGRKKITVKRRAL